MLVKLLTSASLAAALLVGAASSAIAAQDGTASSSMALMDPSSYVAAAGASDLFEIQEGQVAERMGQTAAVRSFGKKMVTDHTKSTAMVKAAAMKSGMTPAAPMLTADQQQMLTQLQSTSPTSFDSTYVQQQMQSHQMALQVQHDYAKKRL